MGEEITVIDDSDIVGWAASATRIGEVYMFLKRMASFTSSIATSAKIVHCYFRWQNSWEFLCMPARASIIRSIALISGNMLRRIQMALSIPRWTDHEEYETAHRQHTELDWFGNHRAGTVDHGVFIGLKQ